MMSCASKPRSSQALSKPTRIVPENLPPHPNSSALTPPSRSALRKLLVAQRHALSHTHRSSQNVALLTQAKAVLNALPAQSVIALFSPIAGEPNLLALAGAAYPNKLGLRFALPVVVAKHQALRFALWAPGDALEADAYGIAVPSTKHWVEPTVLFVPCVGYCHHAGKPYRLGYGGGYYDRSLTQLNQTTAGSSAGTQTSTRTSAVVAVGVAWRSAQCEFEVQSHDVALDAMLTA